MINWHQNENIAILKETKSRWIFSKKILETELVSINIKKMEITWLIKNKWQKKSKLKYTEVNVKTIENLLRFFPFFSFFINIGSQYLHTTAEIILVVLDKLFVLIALSTTDAIAYDISQLLNRVSLRDTVQSLPQMISASAQRPFSCACRFHGDPLFDHPHSFTVDTTISFPGKGFIVS